MALKKEFMSKRLGKPSVYTSLEGAVGNGSEPVEIFEVVTTSLGWFRRKIEVEKVNPPDVAAEEFDD